MKTINCKSRLQVQPQHQSDAQWTALSHREGLFFESLEPIFVPDEWNLDDPSPMLQWYRDCGRTTALHGAFIDVNPASGDMAFRDLSRRRCRESCRLARFMGAEYVVFHSSAFPFLRGEYLQRWADLCAEFYGQLAGEYGLHICVENSMDVDPDPLRMLMQKCRGADVGVCLDIGHAAYSRAPIAAWFEALGDSISYLHLSDNMGLFDDHLPIGSGKINWAEANALWRQLNRFTPITLEVGGMENVQASVAWLKEHRYFALEDIADE